MKPIILLFLAVFAVSIVHASAPIGQILPQVTRNDIYMTIDRLAFVYSVDSLVMKRIVFCESSYNPQAVNINSREVSRGLVQINTLTHNVTKEQAEDPEYAIRFLAKNLKEGRADEMWVSCYKKATS